eukprot:gb/GECG01013812.1/.p1 GENE.gb/GECG01013812.1/~~gb/GECG01013812.1/.p1  ORF type:complete len:211 (+),score=11.79 gb/GECG01013812.1/:1-633(+)
MVDRRQTLLYGGGVGGGLAFVFTIAAMANHNWLGVTHPKETSGRILPNKNITQTMGVFQMEDGLHDAFDNAGVSFSTPLKAAQAFVVLGFLCTLVAIAASVYGGWKQNASHPWPKFAFLSFALHFVFNFCALIAFGVVKHKIGSNQFLTASYSGGYAPILILFFMNLGLSIFLTLKFGIAGVVGTGALPEGTAQFSGESMGGYQVSEEAA